MKTRDKKISHIFPLLLAILFLGITATVVKAQDQYSGAGNPGANPTDTVGANTNPGAGAVAPATQAPSTDSSSVNQTGDNPTQAELQAVYDANTAANAAAAASTVSSPVSGNVNTSSQLLNTGGLVNTSVNLNLSNSSSGKNLNYLVGIIIGYINEAIYLLVGVAVVMFIFYVIKYFIKPADGAERKEAGTYVMYSVLGFFIILSLWGLVNIVKNTFNLDSSSTRLSQFQNIFPTN